MIPPCEKVKAPAPEQSRDRVLTDTELQAFWHGCDAIGWPFGAMFQLLVLTGQRRDEVAAMRWREIDLTKRLWTLPKERAKNNVEHVVPLSMQAIAILAALPHVKSTERFIFTTNGERPVSGFSTAKDRVELLMKEAIGRRNQDMQRWSLHDIRRTVATGMARLGINLPVIEEILNHVSGSFGGIVGVYQRHSFADEKRIALERWGRFVAQLATDNPASNVVELAMERVVSAEEAGRHFMAEVQMRLKGARARLKTGTMIDHERDRLQTISERFAETANKIKRALETLDYTHRVPPGFVEEMFKDVGDFSKYAAIIGSSILRSHSLEKKLRRQQIAPGRAARTAKTPREVIIEEAIKKTKGLSTAKALSIVNADLRAAKIKRQMTRSTLARRRKALAESSHLNRIGHGFVPLQQSGTEED